MPTEQHPEPGRDLLRDRQAVEYLEAGRDSSGSAENFDDFDAGMDADERAELDDLRALLADPRLWAEPRPELEDSVVDAIAREADNRSALRTVERDPGISGPDQDLQSPVDLFPMPEPTELERARERRAARSGWSRALRPAPLLSVAAVFIALVVTAVIVLSNRSGPRYQVALTGSDLAPAASGTAIMTRTNSGWEIDLNLSGLPRLDGGKFYQAWLKNAAGVLVPIGSFNDGADVVLWSGVSPADFPTLTITREMADGKQDSSGQRVAVGNAVLQ